MDKRFILSEIIEREISVPEIYYSLSAAQSAMAAKLGQALGIPAAKCLDAILSSDTTPMGDKFIGDDNTGVTETSAYCHVHHNNMDWFIHQVEEPSEPVSDYLYVVSSRRDYPDSDESYYGADSVHLSTEAAHQAINKDMDSLLQEDLKDQASSCDVDRYDYTIQAGSQHYNWRIDPVALPTGIRKSLHRLPPETLCQIPPA